MIGLTDVLAGLRARFTAFQEREHQKSLEEMKALIDIQLRNAVYLVDLELQKEPSQARTKDETDAVDGQG